MAADHRNRVEADTLLRVHRHRFRAQPSDSSDALRRLSRIINASRQEGPERIYTVVGNICETDTFGVDRRLVEAHEGDILAIRNAGAYGYVMSSNYNSRPRTAEVIVDGGASDSSDGVRRWRIFCHAGFERHERGREPTGNINRQFRADRGAASAMNEQQEALVRNDAEHVVETAHERTAGTPSHGSHPARPRVFSGIQPSGDKQLGNYLGAIRGWAARQHEKENFFSSSIFIR